MTAPLLELEGVARHWPVKGGVVRAVDGVSFSLARGETLALVGESGCGKSTTARLALRLIEPSAGKVRVIRGTNGASPASGTGATSRTVSSTAGLPGNSEAVWPSSPRPRSTRSKSGRAGSRLSAP